MKNSLPTKVSTSRPQSAPVATKPDVGRYVIIHNPSGEKLAEECVDELRASKLGKPVTKLLTRKGGYIANAELLTDSLEPGDAIGMVSGDGTFRDIAGALIIPGLVSIAPGISITSLAGGYARDIGRAIHPHRNNPPSKLFNESAAVEAYGIRCDITTEGNTVSHRAMSYLGFGKTAEATKKINTPEYRGMRSFVRDAKIGLYVLYGQYSFGAIDNDGEEKELSDLTFAKGSRIAKYGRFPMQHWDEAFRVAPVESGRLAAHIASAGMLTGLAAGENYSEPYTFTPTTEVYAHFDGEPPVPVSAGSEVTVGLEEQSYTLLTTRLQIVQ
jgi:diacylglycerol kinase family enzyme